MFQFYLTFASCQYQEPQPQWVFTCFTLINFDTELRDTNVQKLIEFYTLKQNVEMISLSQF